MSTKLKEMKALASLLLTGLLWVPTPVAAQQFTLVSTAADGTASSAAHRGIISADGRFVAFESAATNLVAGLNPAPPYGVYVRDLQTATTSLASIGTNGESVTTSTVSVQAISADGRFVLLNTTSALAAEDTNATQCTYFNNGVPTPGPCPDIYLRDRQTNQTALISQSTGGGVGNGASTSGSMSDDGRFVVFLSTSTNLAPASSPLEQTQAFLRDRLTNTTTRLDLPRAAAGELSTLRHAAISADGSTIFYTRQYTGVAAEAICPGAGCEIAALMDRATGATHTIQLPAIQPNVNAQQSLTLSGLSADGRYALLNRLITASMPSGVPASRDLGYSLLLYDRQETRVVVTLALPNGFGQQFNQPSAALRADGRGFFYKMPGQGIGTDIRVLYYDIQTQQTTPALRLSMPLAVNENTPMLDVGAVGSSADGSRLVIGGFGNLGIPVPNQRVQVYTFRTDGDGDGMFDAWETAFGLNPADPGDASADPDLDDVTNVVEYRRGSHPTARFTRYLAEGSSNDVFATNIALLNPTNTRAAIVMRYLGAGGAPIPSESLVLGPLTHLTIGPPPKVPGDFSTVIESDVQIVASREFTVQSVGHGGQAETAIVQPSTTWYFAEGATGGPFSLFYQLQNPGEQPAQVDVTFLLPAPQPPLTKTYTLEARSRRTLFVDEEDPVLAATNISAKITSDRPIVAERALYLASLGQPLGAVTGAAGVTAPATRWFMAEGATGPFFDLYVLLANPTTTATDVTLTYLLPDGTHFIKTYPVAGQSRQTILIDEEDPRLDNTPVSVIAESANGVPIIAERAQWWPQGNWYEGHASMGATAASRKWALAGGAAILASTSSARTFIMIANVSNVAGTATVTFVAETAATPQTVQLSLPANSRTTVPLDWYYASGLFNLAGPIRFGAVVASPDVDLVVEQAVYRDVNGVIWAAGTVALGEPIP